MATRSKHVDRILEAMTDCKLEPMTDWKWEETDSHETMANYSLVECLAFAPQTMPEAQGSNHLLQAEQQEVPLPNCLRDQATKPEPLSARYHFDHPVV